MEHLDFASKKGLKSSRAKEVYAVSKIKFFQFSSVQGPWWMSFLVPCARLSPD